MLASYILVDTTLLGESRGKIWIKKERYPSWIAQIYGRNAMEVSPLIIDIRQAIQASKLAIVMDIINSYRPQLGISFIESNLSIIKITNHLRKFIYVRTSSGKELTLRFADCAVLPALAAILEPPQWAALTQHFKSWKIHDRDGFLISLPTIKNNDTSDLPLLLLDEQISSLRESMAADQLLFNVRMQRSDEKSIYLTSIAHEYAVQSRRVWHEAGNIDDLDLISFVGYVFDTNGTLLCSSNLPSVLAQKNRSEMHSTLKKMINILKKDNTYYEK